MDGGGDFYALTKYPSETQYPYFIRGVTRGVFSFMTSSLNYVQRARLFAAAAGNEQRVGLQMVQMLGKATHNLVALHSTATSYWGNGRTQISSATEVFAKVAEKVVPVQMDGPVLPDDTLAHRRQVFEDLQRLQDGDERALFGERLMEEIVRAGGMFVYGAEVYGWPAPGFSSGDVHPWQPESLM